MTATIAHRADLLLRTVNRAEQLRTQLFASGAEWLTRVETDEPSSPDVMNPASPVFGMER